MSQALKQPTGRVQSDKLNSCAGGLVVYSTLLILVTLGESTDKWVGGTRQYFTQCKPAQRQGLPPTGLGKTLATPLCCRVANGDLKCNASQLARLSL